MRKAGGIRGVPDSISLFGEGSLHVGGGRADAPA